MEEVRKERIRIACDCGRYIQITAAPLTPGDPEWSDYRRLDILDLTQRRNLLILCDCGGKVEMGADPEPPFSPFIAFCQICGASWRVTGVFAVKEASGDRRRER